MRTLFLNIIPNLPLNQFTLYLTISLIFVQEILLNILPDLDKKIQIKMNLKKFTFILIILYMEIINILNQNLKNKLCWL